MLLDEKSSNFVVNSTIPLYDVALLEVFSEYKEDGEDDWNVSMEL